MTASCASVPEDMPIACFTPTYEATAFSKASTRGPRMKLLALVDVGRHAKDLLADRRVLLLQVEERDGNGGRGHGGHGA